MNEREKEWREKHQAFELKFHQGDNYRWHDKLFVPPWEQNFGNFLGLAPDQFGPDEKILDIGCGSRSAFAAYFTSGEIWNLDPLAAQYLSIPEVAKHWTPDLRERLIAAPAEQLQPELVGECSFVNCWNCLDHSYNWREIIENIIVYASPGAVIALCTDTKEHGAGHPGIDSVSDLLRYFFEYMEIEKLEINYGKTVIRDLAIKAIKR